ncbi:MAG: dicarboxylate/amino acid:cation symporter [Deltaproteobacteria bacterium]|nr:dicarboxylate/amino acid:cation symporter [Myxococcales bacterium]MDP3214282.1 dicarboxylate/amino acid:cation symporter [Deltaproteobacteria bacterium]
MSAAPGGGRFPLSARIVVAVVLGIVAARVLGPRAAPLGDVGMLVIRALKALATPLILFAVLDAFARTEIPGRQAARLFGLSSLNALVAIALGLGVSHTINAGARWQGHLTELLGPAHAAAAPAATAAHAGAAAPTLNPLTNLGRMIPESVVEPFVKNQVISAVLIAVALGVALRGLKRANDPALVSAIATWESFAHGGLALFSGVLHGVVKLVPFAVFAVVASVVARTGVGVFAALGPFLATVMLGLFLHAVVWYGILVSVAARRSPVAFFVGASDAALTALSCGSSLATLPITLRCLQDKLKVSPASARLAACVGTNLNHDGIILYEAAAAIFVTQALGTHLTLSQQVTVALSSVMAGIGIAGVPEAGLITLPLVLGAAGVPDATVLAVVPLLLPIDWLVGRGRAATNVLSDMAVATVLDRWETVGPRGDA